MTLCTYHEALDVNGDPVWLCRLPAADDTNLCPDHARRRAEDWADRTYDRHLKYSGDTT